MSGFNDITVVIVARDAAATIQRAIQSARAAGATRIMIVDDASVDNTVDLIHNLENPVIRVILKPQHTTLGEARELANQNIETPLWIGLDADDEFLPNRLELCLSAFEKGCDLYLDGSVKSYDNGKREDQRIPIPSFIINSSVCRIFERNYLPVTGPIAVKTRLSQKIAYDADFETAEDYDFLLRLLASGPKVHLEETCAYRVHERANSISHQHLIQRNYVKRALHKHDYNSIRELYLRQGISTCVTAWALCSLAIFREEWQVAEKWLFETGNDGLNNEQILEAQGPYPFPENWRFQFYLGTLRLLQGDTTTAVHYLKNALELRRSPEVLNNLGLAVWNAGQMHDGRNHINEAVHLFSGYWDAVQNLQCDHPGNVTTHLLRARETLRVYSQK